MDREALVGRALEPAGLKALAHPLRFQLLELLIEAGPGTSSSLGRQVGESSGTTSYHLRRLAEVGLIEEAPEIGTGRDRYWRALEGGYSLSGLEMLERDDTRAAAESLMDEVLRTRLERTRRWHTDAPRWGDRWAEATVETTARLRLTHAQLEQLSTDLLELMERYRAAQVEVDTPDSAAVAVHADAFPIGDPPG